MKRKNILIVILCLVLVVSTSVGYVLAENMITGKELIVARTMDEPYDFPIKKGTDEWAALTTIHDKIEACQIPEDILTRLTTEALIETVRNYPLGVNIFAYDSIDMGYEKVKSQFNGLAELEKRMLEENATTAAILDEYAMQTVDKGENAEFEDCFIDTVRGCINKNTTGLEIAGTGTEEPLSVQASSTYVRTPNGTQVEAIKGLTWNDWYVNSNGQITKASVQLAHEEVQETYPSVTYVSGAGINPAYNCHSYAWYSTSTSNSYWINDPSNYILDGSYVEASYYHVGAKILYGTPGNQPEHSAIVSAVSDYHLTYVTSKWGCMGVYKHLYYDCPYESGIKKYHQN